MCEKTLLVGIRELTRKTNVFFPNLSCVVWEHPLRNFKLNVKKILIKKGPG